MLKRQVLYSILSIVAIFASIRSSAQTLSSTPRTLSYQGMISGDNEAVTGERLLTVTLYGDPEGTVKLWQGSMKTLIDRNGIFNVLLGSTDNPLPQSQSLDRPLFIGISIEGSPELMPRGQITASPYAINVGDGAITSRKLSSGSVTADKLNLDYISSISVNGQKITNKGDGLNIVGDVTYDEVAKSLMIHGQEAAVHSGKGSTAQNDPDDWTINGNTGTSPGTNYVGTSDSVALEIHVNEGGSAGGGNQRVMLYDPNGISANITGGFKDNSISSAVGSVITGGGQSGYPNTTTDNFVFIGGGDSNAVSGHYSVVTGGHVNTITNAQYSNIAGGTNNSINVGAHYSTLGGGKDNQSSGARGVISGGEHNNILSDYGVIGGGQNNKVGENPAEDDVFATVGGGHGNWAHEEYSTIAGGDTNYAGSRYGFIGGGQQNYIEHENIYAAHWATIGGGKSNRVLDLYGTVGGGEDNRIDSGGDHSAILGGLSNTARGLRGFIGAGSSNLLDTGSVDASIAGGQSNLVDAYYSAIDGGVYNYIRINETGEAAFIGAGANDTVLGSWSALSGGRSNIIDSAAKYSFIGSGEDNEILRNKWYASITGGQNNSAQASYSVISGGFGHVNQGSYGFIGAGIGDSISQTGPTILSGNGKACFIGAGEYNVIDGSGLNDAAEASAIVAGDSNRVGELGSIIGAGTKNLIEEDNDFIGAGKHNSLIRGGSTGIVAGEYNQISSGQHSGLGSSFIGAGDNNTVNDVWSGIMAGKRNLIYAGEASAIIAGKKNWITTNINTGEGSEFIGAGDSNRIFALRSMIGAGENNVDTGINSAIGAGQGNIIGTGGFDASIPGGDSLTAQSFAQTVVGFHNVPSGAFTQGMKTKWTTNQAHANEPILIVGNGTKVVPANAFEVSYDGHTTVSDVNGSGALPGRPALQGATYQDNVVYAWADVPSTGIGALPHQITANSDFGVFSVWHTAPGTYVVTLNTASGSGNPPTPIDLSQASITVTIENNDTTGIGPLFSGPVDTSKTLMTASCAYATASQIGLLVANPSSFIVDTYIGLPGDCIKQDRAFFLKVTGRK